MALFVCPRCASRGLTRIAAEGTEVLRCNACEAQFPAELTPLLDTEDDAPAICECVIWRHGMRRCELWRVAGSSRLRMYEGGTLTVDEPFVRGKGWARALELRVPRES